MKRIFALAAVFLWAAGEAAAGTNPWGVMAPQGQDTPQSVIDAAKDAGASYLRPRDLSAPDWIRTDGKCGECFKLRNSGLGLVVTLRNAPEYPKGKGFRASVPPKDLAAYQKTSAQILENLRPALLVIENKEDDPSSYHDGTASGVWDSPNDGVDSSLGYARMLNVACEEAHQRNLKCANGGLSSESSALLAWFQYVSLGQQDAACSFAKRALAEKDKPESSARFCAIKSPSQVPDRLRKKIEVGRKLLQVYKNSPIDYVNFHWNLRDPKALGETADFLRQATGKQPISNEIGLASGEKTAGNAAALFQAVKEKGFAFAVWRNPAQGRELKKFIEANYP